ncbi:hypothetical protein E2C01_013310 [Portunus trituberculatus]|uniref:Uncharacterized protein n=1 Tax=Portunus trituberculatus TaxID=210409 RepID=A0A5B7DGA3_PORTR|nr:hypothetical protein [Portunus trituberculatus]
MTFLSPRINKRKFKHKSRKYEARRSVEVTSRGEGRCKGQTSASVWRRSIYKCLLFEERLNSEVRVIQAFSGGKVALVMCIQSLRGAQVDSDGGVLRGREDGGEEKNYDMRPLQSVSYRINTAAVRRSEAGTCCEYIESEVSAFFRRNIKESNA